VILFGAVLVVFIYRRMRTAQSHCDSQDQHISFENPMYDVDGGQKGEAEMGYLDVTPLPVDVEGGYLLPITVPEADGGEGYMAVTEAPDADGEGGYMAVTAAPDADEEGGYMAVTAAPDADGEGGYMTVTAAPENDV